MSRDHPLLPFLVAAMGIATFGMMDAAMKRASIDVGVYTALLFRSIVATGLVAPLWLSGAGKWPGRAALKVHATRSMVVAAMLPLWFWGIVRIPLAEAMALSFTAPLVALYLAAVVLHERIRRAAIVASLLGLAGVVIIAAPRFGAGATSDETGWGIAAIIVSSLLYAWNLILQRQQAQAAGPREIALFQNVMCGLIFALAAPWLAHWPGWATLGIVAIAAVLAVISLMLLSWGYARAQAQALVPIEYSAFLWAALMGWMWFGEAVTPTTLAGAGLIVAGCWIATRGASSQARPGTAGLVDATAD